LNFLAIYFVFNEIFCAIFRTSFLVYFVEFFLRFYKTSDGGREQNKINYFSDLLDNGAPLVSASFLPSPGLPSSIHNPVQIHNP